MLFVLGCINDGVLVSVMYLRPKIYHHRLPQMMRK